MGLNGRVQQKVLFLTKKQIKAQFQWAVAHWEWDLAKWIIVWFSDESKYLLFCSNGKLYCCCGVGEEFLPENVTQTMKHGGGKVNVWGVISYDGVGPLVRIDGNLDAIKYTRILDSDLMHAFSACQVDPEDVIFQQDNDPKHTSKRAAEWFNNNNITKLDWPSNSPGLNIIEHVWALLERKVRRQKPLPTNEDQLFAALEEEWYSISQQEIHTLYESMPRRVEACFKSKGRHTKY